MNLLESALDEAAGPVEVFFRDDDAGWGDAQLLRLSDLFAAHRLPLDLAVIPAELTPGLAAELRSRPVGLHQHGYAHLDHQREGRKCEFGSDRSRAEQERDIATGRERLRELLGDRLDPFFTPPWNRCTRDTGEALVALGFAALSREHRAEPLGLLPEVSVHLDVARLAPEELDARFAAHVRAGGPVGVMFHHAVMERDAFDQASELLALLAHHPMVRARPLLT
jgi:Polysaccharide deacetylase